MNAPSSAYVDESMRVSHGLYVMAAVLVAPSCAATFRAVLRSLLIGKQARLHWRDESDRRRALIVEALAALCPLGIVVVASGLDRRRQERARRKCMETLLWELSGCHAADVVFERRNEVLDARDAELVETLRGRHAMAPRLRARWCSPLEEPLLWMADIVAGVASLNEVGQGDLWAAIKDGVTVARIEVS
ncbi:hypothetical protein ACIBEJ_11965 [Nonomuraea sp. NPDC050790]|uniref:hypothetical protein n=1 Tax=Nonomuraea sp. NPDC050790 TaxID=3364371 RepID=UPI0037ACC29C